MLSKRMGKRDGFPKSWISEVAKMERTIDDKGAKIEEYLEVIDALAKIIEEYHDEDNEETERTDGRGTRASIVLDY